MFRSPTGQSRSIRPSRSSSHCSSPNSGLTRECTAMTAGHGIVIESVSRAYSMAGGQVIALDAVDMNVAPGESIAIVGPSGSGKSTLLHLIAGLDRPTSGRISVFGQRLWEMSESELTHFRATTVGYVFQEAHLLPGLTALENVVVARLPWGHRHELTREARDLLDAVGLGDRIDHTPDRLSG